MGVIVAVIDCQDGAIILSDHSGQRFHCKQSFITYLNCLSFLGLIRWAQLLRHNSARQPQSQPVIFV